MNKGAKKIKPTDTGIKPNESARQVRRTRTTATTGNRPGSSSSSNTSQSSSSTKIAGERGLTSAIPPFNKDEQVEKGNGKGQHSTALHSQSEALCAKLWKACKELCNEKSDSRVTKDKKAELSISDHLATAEKNVDVLVQTLEKTSKQSAALHSRIETLDTKLQNACKDMGKDIGSDKSDSRAKVKGKASVQGHTDHLDSAGKYVDLMIQTLEERSQQLSGLQSDTNKVCKNIQTLCNGVCKEASESQIKGKRKTGKDQDVKDQFAIADQNVKLLHEEIEKKSQQLSGLQSEMNKVCENIQTLCNEASESQIKEKRKTGKDHDVKDQFAIADQNVKLLRGEIEKRSVQLADLKSATYKLCENLQSACDEVSKEASENKVKDKVKTEKNQGLKDLLATADQNIEWLNEEIERRRKTESLKGKANGKRLQEAKENAEKLAKSKISTVTEWLGKLESQIEKDNYDVKVFSRANTTDGSLDEMHKYITSIQDICRKLNNLSSDKESVGIELKLLMNEINEWNNVESIKSANDSSDEMTTKIRTMRKLVYEKKKEFSSAEAELKHLEMEIRRWGEVKTVEHGNELSDGMTKFVRTTRLQLVKRKEELISGSNSAEKVTKELTKQEHDIKKIWKNIFPDKQEFETVSATETLDDLGKYILEIKEKIERLTTLQDKLKTEVSNLQEEVQTFDVIQISCLKNVDGTSSDILRTLRKARIQLYEKKKEIKENLQINKENNNQHDLQLQQHAVTLWETALGTKMDMTNFVDGSKIRVVQILDEVSSEFKKIENVSFKLEAAGHAIFENLIGEKRPVTDTDKLNTSANVLQDTSKFLQKCQKETGMLVESLAELMAVFELDCPHKSISDTFKAIAKTATGFQRKFVKMEEFHAKLRGKNELLLAEIEELKATQNETLNRLSKVAGAKLTENNPNIADLSDPNRPTKLAEQYSELYDNPWTDAFESLKLDEKDCIKFLLNILVDCYKICGDISASHQKLLKRVLSNPTEGTGFEHKKTKQETKESQSTLSAVQSKALSELRKQSADLSVICVKADIRKQYTEWFKTKPLEKYTFLCIELCWFMHVQSPPVCLEKSVKTGSPFDTSRYKQYTKAGKKIDYLVWPALLLHEGGAMLCKGVAQGSK